ncbi:MAG TPA: T9SS type A sorting domain-containing protein, partial [Candidatus Cloacimonadota bacterium]|nr:T9SS type A sorting domain-containing protein [Candidatus Cloacimonadota bacterium]
GGFSDFLQPQVEDTLAYVIEFYGGLQIINVSNPQDPQLVGSYPVSWPGEFAIHGNHAYLTSHNDGLLIVNVTNPQDLQLLGSYPVNQASLVRVVGNTAYVVYYNHVLTIDVSNPQNPQLINTYDAPDFMFDMTFIGSIAYCATGPSIAIVDFSNPQNPSFIGTIQLHPTNILYDMHVSDNYLFVSDRVWDEITVFDISDAVNPTLVYTYHWNLLTFGMFFENGNLYTANGYNNVNVIDFHTIVPTIDSVSIQDNELHLTNYPNPFNPSTSISFDLPEAGLVNLDIYNIRGQKVKNLVSENYTRGYHAVTWNGTDDNRHAVASGVYFARINRGGKNVSRKLVLLK